MSRHFVPVVDNETPRSERDDNAASMRKHRQFDAPHSNSVKRDGAGAASGRSADRNDGGRRWDRKADQSTDRPKRKRKSDPSDQSDRGARGGRLPSSSSSSSSSHTRVGPGGAADAPAAPRAGRTPTFAIPENRPTQAGEDGWERYEGTPFLRSDERGLLFDPRSATYFKPDPQTGELVIFGEPASEHDPAAAAAAAAAAADNDAAAAAAHVPAVNHGSDSWVGRKPTNEDRILENEAVGPLGLFFGLYDGHAGEQCADYLVDNLHKNIAYCFKRAPADYAPPAQPDPSDESDAACLVDQQEANLKQLIECRLSLKQLNDAELDAPWDDDGSMTDTKLQLKELIGITAGEAERLADEVKTANRANKEFEEAAKRAITDGFYLTDQAYLSLARKQIATKGAAPCAGSTAVGFFLHGKAPDDVRVIVPNAGDSRAVLVRAGKALALSDDHKPDRPDETKRIKRAGGHVIDHGGVFRIASARAMAGAKDTIFLSVARAFGDISLKEPDPCVTSEPEIEVRHLIPGDTAVILGCDGIWDVLSNQDAVDIQLEHPGSPKEAATAIVRAAYNKKSEDNLTVTVVEFPWARAPLPVDDAEDEDEDEEETSAQPAAVDDELDMFGDD